MPYELLSRRAPRKTLSMGARMGTIQFQRANAGNP